MKKIKALAAKVFDRTFLRFVAVGMINTVIGYGIMFGCYNLLGLDYWLSSAANYFFGSILSYFMNKYITFRSKSGGIKTVLRFALNIAVCYLVGYGVARPFIRWVMDGMDKKLVDNVAMLFGSCVFAGLNYLSQRFLTFREE